MRAYRCSVNFCYLINFGEQAYGTASCPNFARPSLERGLVAFSWQEIALAPLRTWGNQGGAVLRT